MEAGGAGARIRSKRIERGLSQTELAQRAQISASYLSLIEHDRRPVSGKALARIASALGSDPATLSGGADAQVVKALSRAASRHADAGEAGQAVRFAAEFPDWAQLVVDQSARIAALEAQVAAMGDRMAHDPALSASVHDVLSVATAIRSTAAILAAGEPLEREWQDRFHRNIHEDSRRLASSAQGLAAYLTDGRREDELATPEEEVTAWLAERDHVVRGTEAVDDGLSAAGRAALGRYLQEVRADVAMLDPVVLLDAFQDCGRDPFATVDALEVAPEVVLRSIARLPEAAAGPVGLVECDGAGAVLHRRAVPGFDIPRAGAACALWPIFQVLLSSEHPRRDLVRQAGPDARPMLAYSVARIGRAGGSRLR